jgi:predicted enzyme related to lactoylglutathione lyase
MPSNLQIGWLTVDSHDPRKLGAFWKEALDMEVVHEDDDGDEYALSGKGRMGSSWNILFYKAPDEKKVKNRLHLDLIPDGPSEDEAKRLEALGATRADIGQKDVTWIVMADPEGNEFCILSPRDDV